MASIHKLSDVQFVNIGEGTRTWQSCIVLPGAKIGKDCNIRSNVFIESDVVTSDTGTVKCGVELWDGLRLEDDVFIGPNVALPIMPSRGPSDVLRSLFHLL